jgi:hypothetical protein
VYAHAAGAEWTLDASAPGNCESGQVCVATIRIGALGDFHVNPSFPHKFIGHASSGMHFVGGDVFSVATGAYSPAGEKAGILTVRFEGDAAGTIALSGMVKTCVCTDTDCLPREVPVTLNVPML